MTFCDMTKPLYLETDTSSVCLRSGPLQVRDGMNYGQDGIPDNTELGPITFASKSLSTAEWWYSNIKQEGLGILHGLEKFNHYCFKRGVYVITDCKPLVVVVSKDIATLSQQLQCIMLCIYQYIMCILYKNLNQICI